MAKPKMAMIPSTVGGSVYSVLPSNGDGDFDFSRASAATRINAQGLIETVAIGDNRLNYPLLDGRVQTCPHLLLEPQRTNLIPYSEDFSNAAWVKTGLTVNTNQTLSPDGTLNADEVNITVANAHYLFDSISVSALTNYTFTFYVKKGTATDVSYSILNAVNFTNIVNTTSYFNQISDTDWTRISVEFTTPSGCTSIRVYPLRDGSSIGTVYIYGASLEEGSYPTSYIVSNSGSATTRLAEVCDGSGNASTFNDSEGVLMAQIGALANDGTYRVFGLSDGTGNNRIIIYYNPNINNIELFIASGGSAQTTLSVTLSDVKLFQKVAVKYKINDISLWINGFELRTDTNATMPIGLNELLFNGNNGVEPFYGKTKQVQYFDSVLTDSELETLTSWMSFSDMAIDLNYTIQ